MSHATHVLTKVQSSRIRSLVPMHLDGITVTVRPGAKIAGPYQSTRPGVRKGEPLMRIRYSDQEDVRSGLDFYRTVPARALTMETIAALLFLRAEERATSDILVGSTRRYSIHELALKFDLFEWASVLHDNGWDLHAPVN